ncbi:MAG TPA: hypothetical protein VGK20_17670 [Candidatus Binatia bacterium]|jgi:hypothetical protein
MIFARRLFRLEPDKANAPHEPAPIRRGFYYQELTAETLTAIVCAALARQQRPIALGLLIVGFAGCIAFGVYLTRFIRA